MTDRVIATKLNVFNMGDRLSFDVNTPQFLKEACENAENGMYVICWNIFRSLLAQVAKRATELNDPVLNTLMIRLNLYDIPNKERYKVIKQLEELYEESRNNEVMTDKQKIIAEIERLKKQSFQREKNSTYICADYLLRFINSLSEEPVIDSTVLMYGVSASTEEAVKNRKEYNDRE